MKIFSVSLLYLFHFKGKLAGKQHKIQNAQQQHHNRYSEEPIMDQNMYCVPGHYDPINSKSSVTCIVAFNLSGSTKTFTMFLIHTQTHTPMPKDTLEHVGKVHQQILGVIEK